MNDREKIQCIWVIFWVLISILCGSENTYKMSGYIDNGYIVDEAGEVWEYDNSYKNGTEVEITFNTNCTDSRYDDKIYKIVEKN